MDLQTLYVSQRRLRNPGQLPRLIAAVCASDPLPPILISEDDDGSLQLEDGHHRALAYVLAGRARLERGEYVLIPRERRRPRFGRLVDLAVRVRADR